MISTWHLIVRTKYCFPKLLILINICMCFGFQVFLIVGNNDESSDTLVITDPKAKIYTFSQLLDSRKVILEVRHRKENIQSRKEYHCWNPLLEYL